MDSSNVEKSFDLVLSKTRQALGACLLSLGHEQIDATTAFSAIMWAAISLAKEAELKSIQSNKLELSIDFDILVRYTALMISGNWKLEPETLVKLKDIAFHNNQKTLSDKMLN